MSISDMDVVGINENLFWAGERIFDVMFGKSYDVNYGLNIKTHNVFFNPCVLMVTKGEIFHQACQTFSLPVRSNAK